MRIRGGGFLDITHMRRGMLTAAELVGYREHRDKGYISREGIWRCQCDCGNSVFVSASAFKAKGRPKQCGCKTTRKVGVTNFIMLDQPYDFIRKADQLRDEDAYEEIERKEEQRVRETFLEKERVRRQKEQEAKERWMEAERLQLFKKKHCKGCKHYRDIYNNSGKTCGEMFCNYLLDTGKCRGTYVGEDGRLHPKTAYECDKYDDGK